MKKVVSGIKFCLTLLFSVSIFSPYSPSLNFTFPFACYFSPFSLFVVVDLGFFKSLCLYIGPSVHFLSRASQLYTPLCRSVCPSVGPSIRHTLLFL